MKPARRITLRLLLCLAVISGTTDILWAQRASSSIGQRFKTDLSHTAQGIGHVATSPLRWQGRDWALLGAVVASTFAISFADEEVNDFFVRNKSDLGDDLAEIGIQYGEPRTVVIIAGSVYLIGLIGDDEWLRDTAVIMAAALVPAGALQTVTKMASGRARPHLGLGYDEFDPFRNEEAYYSFFSGHTLVTMATSHAFARRIKNRAVRTALYGLGALGGFSRLYNEDHWLSDVTLGSIVGILSVNSAAKWLAQQKQGKSGNKLGLQWHLMPATNGLLLSLSW